MGGDGNGGYNGGSCDCFDCCGGYNGGSCDCFDSFDCCCGGGGNGGGGVLGVVVLLLFLLSMSITHTLTVANS